MRATRTVVISVSMSLDEYLADHGFTRLEGHTNQEPREVAVLEQLASRDGVQRILEIGFNAGHSASLFLSANPRCHVLSFDLGWHQYVEAGKAFIDRSYPGRHTLVLGDSTETVLKHDADVFYDLIFIDGGHQYDVARQDLANCRRFAHPKTVVAMDDTIHSEAMQTSWAIWTVGPTKAWREALTAGTVIETSHIDFGPGRGISWGHYRF